MTLFSFSSTLNFSKYNLPGAPSPSCMTSTSLVPENLLCLYLSNCQILSISSQSSSYPNWAPSVTTDNSLLPSTLPLLASLCNVLSRSLASLTPLLHRIVFLRVPSVLSSSCINLWSMSKFAPVYTYFHSLQQGPEFTTDSQLGTLRPPKL